MDNTNNNTNDINALLLLLSERKTNGCYFDQRYHASLTALIAERDALKQRVAELERDVDMWREDAHKWKKMYDCHYESERIWISRVVELERQMESQPAERDRELRERDDTLTKWMDQVTAMLCHSMTHSHDAKQELVTRCDAAIAAMRKGAINGK